MFDQVKEAFLNGGPINSLSLINSSKLLMLRVNLEPPNFFKILLITLKTPPPNIAFQKKLDQKGLKVPTRNPSLGWNY